MIQVNFGMKPVNFDMTQANFDMARINLAMIQVSLEHSDFPPDFLSSAAAVAASNSSTLRTWLRYPSVSLF